MGGQSEHLTAESLVAEAPNYSPNTTPSLIVARSQEPGATRWVITTINQRVARRDFVPTATPPAEIAPEWMIRQALASADWRDAPAGIRTEFYRFGWPWPAVGCQAGPGSPTSDLRIAGAMVAYQWPRPASGVRQRGDVALAWWPVWPGLIGDTILFAAAWWLLALIRVGVVRQWRGRRGSCRACGYSRSGLPSTSPCPECGAASAQ